VLVTQEGALDGKTVTAIAAGDLTTVALCSDGTVTAWGYNAFGQLGNNSTINSTVSVLVTQSGVLAGKTVTAIACGSGHSLALCSDGTLAAWGYNNNGQLGNNSTSSSSVPVLVIQNGVLAGKAVTAIATSDSHNIALCADGSLAAWGYNVYGQLGNNSTSSSSVPVLVNTSALQAGECFMAADGGYLHSLALVASPPAPVATTLAATGVADKTVTLSGSVNANGSATTVAFEHGLTKSYGTSVAASPASLGGTTTTAATAALSNLLPGTTYHYRIVATSVGGTTRGTDMSFTTDTATTLVSLTPSVGALMPAFDPAVTSYAMTLPLATAGITLTPVVARAGATVKVAGNSVASGSASGTIPLASGNNAIPVMVTSPSGTSTQTYTVTVTRVPDPFVFNAATDVAVTAAGFDATGLAANFSL